MNISKVSQNISNTLKNNELKASVTKPKERSQTTVNAKENISGALRQKDILLSALESLENNRQVDNSHPLTRADYMPIDDFEEAMSELSLTKNPKFAQEAYGAQANLNASDVMYLFMEN